MQSHAKVNYPHIDTARTRGVHIDFALDCARFFFVLLICSVPTWFCYIDAMWSCSLCLRIRDLYYWVRLSWMLTIYLSQLIHNNNNGTVSIKPRHTIARRYNMFYLPIAPNHARVWHINGASNGRAALLERKKIVQAHIITAMRRAYLNEALFFIYYIRIAS